MSLRPNNELLKVAADAGIKGVRFVKEHNWHRHFTPTHGPLGWYMENETDGRRAHIGRDLETAINTINSMKKESK